MLEDAAGIRRVVLACGTVDLRKGIDELGYISFDREGTDLLFNNLSLRAGRKSMIVTSNLSFARWDEVFGDPTITNAIVDRLTHKAIIIDMEGESYRLKESKELNQTY